MMFWWIIGFVYAKKKINRSLRLYGFGLKTEASVGLALAEQWRRLL
jgi:hypothetical protein